MSWAVDVVGEAGSAARFVGARERPLEGEGIDDLAKYRIVMHLLQHPWLEGDAELYASTLGFHSRERTRALLEEMCGSGLLSKREGPEGRVEYGLTPDSSLRKRLSECCAAGPGSPEYLALMRRLAQRSVDRAKIEAQRLKAS